MIGSEAAAAPFAGRTAWARRLETPLRAFLRTESGSAAVLLVATLIALAWANIDVASYESVWRMPLSIRLGGSGVSQTLREWVNSGLMTFFFFLMGLEARREFDMGELRERGAGRTAEYAIRAAGFPASARPVIGMRRRYLDSNRSQPQVGASNGRTPLPLGADRFRQRNHRKMTSVS